MSFPSYASDPSAPKSQLSAGHFVDPDDIRNAFTIAMPTMYRNEVPLYGDLVRIVQKTNEEALSAQSESQDSPGYYDLSVAGLPTHATYFQPTQSAVLAKNPFRVFTTLLRPEMLQDEEARSLALTLLDRREIFSPQLLNLVDTAEQQNNRLNQQQSETFIVEAIKTFSWRLVASASEAEYKKLASEHPILADVASFKSSHTNHLAPRTLDITPSQNQMSLQGLKVKDRIEGPPPTNCPILLRQTSFLALEERIKFQNPKNILVEGTHRARFGEIEERGATVTPAGRKLYDDFLVAATERYRALPTGTNPAKMDEILADVFRAYPDNWTEPRKQGLVYFTYELTTKLRPEVQPPNASLEFLVSEGLLKAIPITYEDFLPFSAAGIFQSNLSSGTEGEAALSWVASSEEEGFEEALGCKLVSADALYREAQYRCLEQCAMGSGSKIQ